MIDYYKFITKNIFIAFLLSSHANANPKVEKIIENAPNPIGGANIFDFHHYALNRDTFDNTQVQIPGNNFGLSLNSSHPHFSENLAGNVISYYDNGEKPKGTTSSVWDFLMNASGDPLEYTPTPLADKFCVYFHRRYLLSQIAVDASGAITNLGFVNTPDQWWIQVQELFNNDGSIGGEVGPDYLIQDHPESAGNSKFAQLAREQKSIQTQSNEKWCFAYDVPVVIKLIKGKKVINESDVQWPNSWKPWLDPIIKIPSINGYPHFLGANQYPLQPEENSNNVQYLGYEYLATLLNDKDYSSSDITLDQSAYIKKNTISAVSIFWNNFVKLGFNTDAEDPFSIELKEIMSKTELPLKDRIQLAKKSINKKLSLSLFNEAKNYPINKFRGGLNSTVGGFDNIKKVFKSIKANGFKNTLSHIKLTSLKNIAKSSGPESALGLGINLWQLANNIKNPGNPVESVMIYYIPGIMDGMVLSVDTSTLINNFHFTSTHSQLNEKNTSQLPITAFNAHIEKNILPFDNSACYFYDENDPTSRGPCLELSQLQLILHSNFQRLQLPKNHWFKIQIDGQVFYLTSSFVESETHPELLKIFSNPSTLIELVDKNETLARYDMCGFSDELYQGAAICTNGVLDLEKEYGFGGKIRSIQINDDSESDINLIFSDDSAVPLIANIPFFDIFEHQPILIRGDSTEPAAIVIYEDSNFEGRSLSLENNVSFLGDLNFNDILSSFEIPNGWTVRFYEHANFEGGYYTRSAGEHFTNHFNDIISSIKVFKSGEPVLYSHKMTFYNGAAYNARFRVIDEKTGAVLHTSSFYLAGKKGSFTLEFGKHQQIEVQKEQIGWKTVKSFSSSELDRIKADFTIKTTGTIFNAGAVLQ